MWLANNSITPKKWNIKRLWYMFCLGTRLDIFSFPSKLPKITPPGCFHRVAFLRLNWQNNWQFFDIPPCLLDRPSPPPCLLKLTKKTLASSLIASSMFIDFTTFTPPYTFIWIWTLKLQIWMDSNIQNLSICYWQKKPNAKVAWTKSQMFQRIFSRLHS